MGITEFENRALCAVLSISSRVRDEYLVFRNSPMEIYPPL